MPCLLGEADSVLDQAHPWQPTVWSEHGFTPKFPHVTINLWGIDGIDRKLIPTKHQFQVQNPRDVCPFGTIAGPKNIDTSVSFSHCSGFTPGSWWSWASDFVPWESSTQGPFHSESRLVSEQIQALRTKMLRTRENDAASWSDKENMQQWNCWKLGV